MSIKAAHLDRSGSNGRACYPQAGRTGTKPREASGVRRIPALSLFSRGQFHRAPEYGALQTLRAVVRHFEFGHLSAFGGALGTARPTFQDAGASAICVLACLLVLTGCSGPKPQPPASAFSDLKPAAVAAKFQSMTNQEASLLKQSQELFVLGPGDRLEIEIIGNVNSRTVTFVGPDGKIYYNLLPGLDVWGMTLAQ